MSSLLSPPTSAPEDVHERLPIAVEGDLDTEGRLGRSRLLIENGEARRYQDTPGGEELVASYNVAELENPRLDDLVDATALVADKDGRAVELLRASNRRNGSLANAERRLRAMVDGKPDPGDDDTERLCPKCGRPLPRNNNVCEACVDRGATLRRLFRYTDPHRARGAVGVVYSLAGSAVELLPPLITMQIINGAIARKDYAYFYWMIAALLGSRILAHVIQILRGRNVAYLGMVIARDIRHSLF